MSGPWGGAVTGAPLSTQNLEFRPAKTGNILVVKHGDNVEFILQGVFQVTHNNFFFTPDGCFNPTNTLNTRFQDVKLNCQLTIPQANSFPFAIADYPMCIENLRMIKKIIKYDKKSKVMSSLSGSVLSST